MTYNTKEQSVQDGQPVEAYKFTSPAGSYLYHDGDMPELIINGETYTSTSVDREAIDIGASLSAIPTLDVTVPFDSEVAVDHGYLLTPEYLELTIYRVHVGDDLSTQWRKIWTGRAISFGVQGVAMKIQTKLGEAANLEGSFLSVYWQRSCNWSLYDSDTCKVNKADFTSTTEIVTVSDDAVTVLSDGVADHELKLGEIVNNRTGEKRLIVDNLANVITINYGFSDVLAGDEVNLSLGCNRLSDTCREVFDNADNFGGWRFIPRENPILEG